MAADRVKLRLHRKGGFHVAEEETNLDVKDEQYLRATLERMVKEKRGTLNLDLSDWSMVVLRANGARLRRVKVLPSGATEVVKHW